MGLLYNLCIDLKNVIFPDYCPGCHQHMLNDGQWLCTHCLLEIPFTDHFTVVDNKTSSHFYGRVPVQASASVVYFKRSGLMQDVLHTFKYEGNHRVGLAFGHIAGEKMLTSPFFRQVDVIIPVPLHPKKQRWRGYNQSEIFARGISQVYGLPIWTDILIKHKENTTQTGMGRGDRVDNVSEVYSLSKSAHKLKDKNVLLVDDVITTGATLEACFNILQQANPKSISVITLACAIS